MPSQFPESWKQGDALSADNLNRKTAAAMPRIRVAPPLQMRQVGSEVVISMPQQFGTNGGDGDGAKWFRIDDAAQDGSNQRWVYSLVEVEKTSAGYGGWTDKAGGIATSSGYNGAENPNNATGTANGIGINLSLLPGTFELKQAHELGSPIVRAWPVVVGGSTEWWFHHVNQIDGEC